MRKATCSRCGCANDRAPAQRYCLTCHAAYMRENRPIHSMLPDEQRKKANARSYANTYQNRGKLAIKPCEVCEGLAEKHHDDYTKPLEVRWLCREHHLELHHGQA